MPHQLIQRGAELLPPGFILRLNPALFASPAWFIPASPRSPYPRGAHRGLPFPTHIPRAAPWSCSTPEAPPRTSVKLHLELAAARQTRQDGCRGARAVAVAVAAPGVAGSGGSGVRGSAAGGVRGVYIARSRAAGSDFSPRLSAGLLLPRSDVAAPGGHRGFSRSVPAGPELLALAPTHRPPLGSTWEQPQ